MKRIFITGGCGFLGSNLAASSSKRGCEVVVFDNLSRLGSSINKDWLSGFPNVKFVHGDVRNRNDIRSALLNVNPDLIFHLAGQVAMTTSLSNPILDFETNVQGSIYLLETVRELGISPVIIYSSTNKVYGDLDNLVTREDSMRYKLLEYPGGIDENTPLDFRSPYGCSKGAADQYMLDYHRNYGLKTIVFRHSSIFGGRQFSTFDQGWIGWFVSCALNKSRNENFRFTVSGNGKQVRDVLFAEDLVSCYFAAASNSKQYGQAYNIGGGSSNSLSLLELFAYLEGKLNVRLEYDILPPRSSDQKVFIADIKKAGRDFGWKPKISKETGLNHMIDWVVSNAK